MTRPSFSFQKLPWKRIALSAGIGLLSLLFLFFGFIGYLIITAPDIDTISVSPRESATYICADDGTYLRKLTFASSNRDIVTADQIPEQLCSAVVAIEDERFYEHSGIDLRGILRAFGTGIATGSFSQGASTITQQLIKNSVFTEWTSETSFYDRFRRKIQEQYLALQLETRMDKEEILTHYLNTINLGSGCYGVQAASRRYFNKDLSELTLSECAVLAAIPQNPSAFNPILHPQANQKRAATVLTYMEEQGYISHQERFAALEDPVYQRILSHDDTYMEHTVYSYYEDALIAQVQEILTEKLLWPRDQAMRAVYSGGLRIYTAQDPALQQICEEEFRNPANFPEDPQPQASLVLMEQSNGLVRAIVGGRGEKTASLTLNRATETTRQPGSTFKILTAYAPALDLFHQTLATEYENKPFQYSDGTPVSNWDISDYSETVTMREAIARSVNTAAVRCITEISPQVGFDSAQNFGISTLHASLETDAGISSDIIQPLALGGITQGVTNLELCSAYAAIANHGVFCEPKFFTKILDRHGSVLFDWSEDRSSHPVIRESTAFLLTSAMEDVVSSSIGTAYGTISAAGHPVAGKTGTTSDYKDIWFTGYTPYYTCSVWGGYDNNQSLPDDPTAHSYSKLLWSAVMNGIHRSLPVQSFVKPDSVITRTLCKTTHLPAKEGICPDTYSEYFEKGTEPLSFCSEHEKLPEKLPETETILIYPDILEELFTETIPESEHATESESAVDSESSTDSESNTSPESSADSESGTSSESDITSESGTDSEFSIDSEFSTDSEFFTDSDAHTSLDDFMNQLLDSLGNTH